jgi:hypothetical protein
VIYHSQPEIKGLKARLLDSLTAMIPEKRVLGIISHIHEERLADVLLIAALPVGFVDHGSSARIKTQSFTLTDVPISVMSEKRRTNGRTQMRNS